MLKNEEGHICRQFFAAFKSNFRQATLAWLIMLPIGLVIAYMVYLYFFGMPSVGGTADTFAVLTLVAAAIYLIALTYVFACAARYENTPVQTVKNGVFIGLRFIGRTLILFAITAAVLFLALWNYTAMFIGVLPARALLCYVHGSFILKIFEKLEEECAQKKLEREIAEHKAVTEKRCSNPKKTSPADRLGEEINDACLATFLPPYKLTVLVLRGRFCIMVCYGYQKIMSCSAFREDKARAHCAVSREARNCGLCLQSAPRG